MWRTGAPTEPMRKWILKESVHPGWCRPFFFCVSVSRRFFHQSASINSSNAALQLCSMRYITLSKRVAPHPHRVNKTAATCFKAAAFLSATTPRRRCPPSSLLSLSCTDYTVFIIHVPPPPLLESIQERRQEGDMKREIAIGVPQ